MQIFTEHALYHGGGDKRYAPKEFDYVPTLIDYINHLAAKGLTVFAIVPATLPHSCWHRVITVENT